MRHLFALLLAIPLFAVSDDFNRADGAPGANWTCVQECTANWAISGNDLSPGEQYASEGEGGTILIRTEAAFPDDQYPEATLADPVDTGDQSNGGVAVRLNATGSQGYAIQVTPALIGVLLLEDDGSLNYLDTCASTQVAGVAYLWRLTMTGTGGTVHRDGSELTACAFTDATYATGKPGLFALTGESALFTVFDNFGSTDPVGGAPSFIPALPNLLLRGGGW